MAENKIYAVLTDRGAQLEAAALASGVPVVLNKFVIGDANGNDDVTPDPSRTVLIHETYRGDIKSSENSGNQVIFTLYVPPETGGYTIREVGILTDKGELYSVARSPDILKPTDSNGALISITYKYTLAVSSASTVNVVIDNSSGMSQADADKRYLQISKNLSEIKDKGAAAQQAGRENLGVNLNNYYKKEEIDNKFSEVDNELNNINPVMTVNHLQPDSDGNVNVDSGYAKLGGDGAFNLVALFPQQSEPDATNKTMPGYRLSSVIFKANPSLEILAHGYLFGLWELIAIPLVTVSSGYELNGGVSGAVMARRIPVGNINKFSNIKKPHYPQGRGVVGTYETAYINIECDIEGVGTGLIFTTNNNDVEEYGRQLYQNAINGMYGTVTNGYQS
ncbi:TPA: phage tail protein [Escherichia coli]|uniref:Putative phage tail protein n=5 Tax=Escherichia coli TaxID=562 RepID=A0A2S8JPS8_ECOLX|nr:phage tail protein [Escherichia coli]EED0144999.1 phage tail protein [Escherichia coli]EEW8462381.1 phage tail protein [Escherichia coli]EFD4949965.1 phage tail protein [Escherichia coli]EFE8010958.1 phage tail protein [Escherichia coli]EFH7328748.1 phage tail protein [Escherichia coli]